MKVMLTFDKLQRRRVTLNYSANALAQESGVSRAHINAIENGRRMPTVNIICMLAYALRCQPQDLFDWEIRR